MDFPHDTEVNQYRTEVDEILAIIYSVANSTPGEKKIRPTFHANDHTTVGEFLSFDRDIRDKQRDIISKRIGFQAFGSVVDLAKRLKETRKNNPETKKVG